MENNPEPLTSHYNALFPQDSLRILYVELDPGVDDGAAFLQLLAATGGNGKNALGKRVIIEGIIPCVGNVVLARSIANTQQFLELTNNTYIIVYPGALSPLAIEGNQTAIEEMIEGINFIHFYGHDGEQDVGGWPPITMNIQTTPGYVFAANRIKNASPNTALTLVSTSSLTELAKTLKLLEILDQQDGNHAGAFSKNIQAISIMGGCVNKSAGCNAPFNVPDNQKNSEANFYFDVIATKFVFELCEKYQIPILLAPLDLTQEPGLYWTKNEVKQLNNTPNAVAQQFARVTDVVPYIDAKHFPKDCYPMHDLQAVTDLLFPKFYNVTITSISVGDVGQITPHNNGRNNVYILSMPNEMQAGFYKKVLKEYEKFNNVDKPSFELEKKGRKVVMKNPQQARWEQLAAGIWGGMNTVSTFLAPLAIADANNATSTGLLPGPVNNFPLNPTKYHY